MDREENLAIQKELKALVLALLPFQTTFTDDERNAIREAASRHGFAIIDEVNDAPVLTAIHVSNGGRQGFISKEATGKITNLAKGIVSYKYSYGIETQHGYSGIGYNTNPTFDNILSLLESKM